LPSFSNILRFSGWFGVLALWTGNISQLLVCLSIHPSDWCKFSGLFSALADNIQLIFRYLKGRFVINSYWSSLSSVMLDLLFTELCPLVIKSMDLSPHWMMMFNWSFDLDSYRSSLHLDYALPTYDWIMPVRVVGYFIFPAVHLNLHETQWF
jgi:hypothetical protein